MMIEIVLLAAAVIVVLIIGSILKGMTGAVKTVAGQAGRGELTPRSRGDWIAMIVTICVVIGMIVWLAVVLFAP